MDGNPTEESQSPAQNREFDCVEDPRNKAAILPTFSALSDGFTSLLPALAYDH